MKQVKVQAAAHPVKPSLTKRQRRQLAALRQEWREHVRATPVAMIPQVMNGHIFVYGTTMGLRMQQVRAHFAYVTSKRWWPRWAKKGT